MAQEFTIKSQAIEDKINQLLPSQGGYQAGVDFSASTMVIPIVDLTESAEGSDVRADLQTAFSHNSITANFVDNSTTETLVTTTGYFRVFGNGFCNDASGSDQLFKIFLNDGSTDKNVFVVQIDRTASGSHLNANFDFVVFLSAGDSLKATATSQASGNVTTRQIADINGNLINPT